LNERFGVNGVTRDAHIVSNRHDFHMIQGYGFSHWQTAKAYQTGTTEKRCDVPIDFIDTTMSKSLSKNI
jgi:hypothetical protein